VSALYLVVVASPTQQAVATRHVDYAVRNVRVPACAGLTLTRLPATPPSALGTAPRLFATAVRAVNDALAAELVTSDEAAKRHTEQRGGPGARI
jgi:hypothetical protein